MEVKNSKEHGKGTSKIFEIGRLFLLICGGLLILLGICNLFIPIVSGIKEIPTTGIIKEIGSDRNIIIETERFEYDDVEVDEEIMCIDGIVHTKAYLCSIGKVGQTIDITLLEKRLFNVPIQINEAKYHFDKYTYMSTGVCSINVITSMIITFLGIVCFVLRWEYSE